MKKGYWYIAATAFLFSTAEIASKLAPGLHPLQLVFLRFLVGGLFLLPFAIADIKKRGLRLGWNDGLFFLLAGFLGVAVSMSLFQFALEYADASVVAVVFSANTVFTSLLAVLLLRERFSGGAAAALALGLIGVGAMLWPFRQGGSLTGVLLSVMSAATFSLFSVLNVKRVERYGGFILNSFSFMCGVALLLPVMLVSGKPLLAGLSWANAPAALYNGVFVTGLGYYCYLSAMRETSAVETSAVFFIKPALAPVLALLVLNEAIGWNKLAGMALIVGAALLLFRRKLAAGRSAAPAGT